VAALYYLKNVVPSLGTITGHTPLFLAGALVMAALGVAAGAIHLSFHDNPTRRLRKGLGVALATAGLFAVTTYVLTPKETVVLRWLHTETEAVADALAAKRPLLIDFMASWCLPCKEFELKVFSDPEVAAEMQSFTLLKVDLTSEDDDPTLGIIKKKYGANTLPAIRLVAPDGRLRGKTDELMTAPAFRALLLNSRADADRPPLPP
jgi:thiol:disulfide interchange protein DsbD